jgi:hypothetical protein
MRRETEERVPLDTNADAPMMSGPRDRGRDDHRARQSCLAGNPWWAGFEAGRLINQLRWNLLQAVLVYDPQLGEEISQGFEQLGSKVFAIAAKTDHGVRLQSRMVGLLEEWRELTGTEEFAESVHTAFFKYRRRALGKEIENDFDDVVGVARHFAKKAKEIVHEAIGEKEGLKTIFVLGKYIDRGLRPLITTDDVFCYETTPEQRCANYQGDEDEDENDVPVQKVIRTPGEEWLSRPVLPERLVRARFVGRKINPGEIHPTSTWAEDVAILWQKVPMPAELPDSVFALARSPDVQVTKELTEAIIGAAAQACERLTVVRTDTGPVRGSSMPGSLSPSTTGIADAEAPDEQRSRGVPPADSNLADERHAGWEGQKGAIEGKGAPSAIARIPGDKALGVPVLAGQPSISANEIERLRKIKKEIDPNDSYIGASLPILRVFEMINELNKVSDESILITDPAESGKTETAKLPYESILITGPTGSGKTLIADLIHRHSGRPKEKFARETAATIRLGDITAAKGRWSGYGRDHGFNNIPKEGRTGILQDYAGGTVFVDEIARVPMEFQDYLFDVLDNELIAPTAGKGDRFRPNVRLIFATNADLDQAVKEGKFMHDLLARIEQRTIKIPPLVERREDVFHFVAARCRDHTPTSKFLLALLRYAWPGNVRELLNALKLAEVRTKAEKDPLTLDHLELKDPAVVQEVRAMSDDDAERAILQTLIEMIKRQGLVKWKGLHVEMGRLLKLHPSTISNQLLKYGLRERRIDNRISPG